MTLRRGVSTTTEVRHAVLPMRCPPAQDLEQLRTVLPMIDALIAKLSAQLAAGEKTVLDDLQDAQREVKKGDMQAAIKDLSNALSSLQSQGATSPHSSLHATYQDTEAAVHTLQVCQICR